MLIVPLVSVEFKTDIDEDDAPRPLDRHEHQISGEIQIITHRRETGNWVSIRIDNHEVILDFSNGNAETERQF